MDEIMDFVMGIVRVDEPDAVISKFRELGVCAMNDLQHINFESTMLSCFKVIPARQLQRAVGKYFHTKSLQMPCTTPSPGPSTSCDVDSTTSNVMKNFKIPYHRFLTSLRRKMEDGERATRSEINHMVRAICDEVWEIIRAPGKSFCTKTAKELVKGYKDTFGDSDDGYDSDAVGACDLIQNKLRNRFNSMTFQAKKRKQIAIESDEDENVPSQAQIKMTKKDKYGTKNFLPSQFPPSETRTTQNKKKIWLKMEFKKNKEERNYVGIKDAMKVTYYSQRVMIAAHLPIKQIREEWPFLFEKEFFLDHFCELMGFDLVERAQESSAGYLPILLKYFDMKISTLNEMSELNAPQSTKDLRDQILLMGEEPLTEGTRLVHAFLCLMALWKKPSERIFIVYQDNMTYEEILAGADAPDHPYVAVMGDSMRKDEQTCYPVVQHNSMEEPMKPSEALLFCFAMYYVFAIQYPSDLASPLEFLQHFILEITEKGSKVKSGRGVRNEITSRVLSLNYHVNYFKRARKL